jgi:hypothetical protein
VYLLIERSDYYHVECFEELLDLSSPHYVARFVPDRKHIPDQGANCILEEYISRWKLRIQPGKEAQQAPDQEEQPQDSVTAAQGAAQTPTAEGQSSVAETTTQQPPVPGTSTDSAVGEQVHASSNVDPIDLTALSDVTTPSSSTSFESRGLDVWRLGDGLWECARQNAAQASRNHCSLFDILDCGADADDVANASADQDQSWHITQYVLAESDPDYDERHALSDALAMWQNDVVS